MGYFGTNEDLPATTSFRAGSWTGVYEAGKLRYLRLGNCEVLRMIYPAIRDQYWRTAPAQILSEKIQIEAQSFSIEYTARYQLEAVDFQAHYLFQGDAEGRLSVTMRGEALSDFQRNRIGLCVLHPIDTCAGKPVSIIHPDGSREASTFPNLISPHQPFIGVQGMVWSPAPGLQVQLFFEGDIFETEDQRNWTDSSYKTYSTPLSIPYPVQVQRGETMLQKLILQAQSDALATTEPEELEVRILEQTYVFPKLGTDWNPGITAQTPALPLDFLNLLLKLDEPDWIGKLAAAAQTAKQHNKKLGLSVALISTADLSPLIQALAPLADQIQQLCILSASDPVPAADLMEATYAALKAKLPQVPIGFGTDGYFTQLNRNRPQTTAFDFLQFSPNPQVHAFDTRTIIENLSAQRDVVRTAQSFDPGKAIHVAPITLRARHNPNPADAIDPRQHSLLAAAWTLLSIKYLAPCAALSYFEWVGEKGILHQDGASPLADCWQQIAEFGPIRIVDTHSSDPLKKDLLLLENVRMERLGFEVDFLVGEIRVLMKFFEKTVL
jgi:D-apionolactonase